MDEFLQQNYLTGAIVILNTVAEGSGVLEASQAQQCLAYIEAAMKLTDNGTALASRLIDRERWVGKANQD